MTEFRFYFDENVDPEISRQLRYHGFDAISIRDLHLQGDSDRNQLQRATELGRILCTYDTDFFYLNAEGIPHGGVIFTQQRGAAIGGWVRAITEFVDETNLDNIPGQVFFVNVK